MVANCAILISRVSGLYLRTLNEYGFQGLYLQTLN